MYTELDINLLPHTPRGADATVVDPYANGLPDAVQQQLAHELSAALESSASAQAGVQRRRRRAEKAK